MDDSKLDDVLARLALPSPKAGTRRLLLLLAWTCCFCGIMAWEWCAGPNRTPAFGPFAFIHYQAFDGGTLVVTLILLAMIFAFPVKPGFVTLILSILGVLGWFFMGLIGQGIGC